MQHLITPVILSGGSGTRLWPYSRADKPKQFLEFGDGQSLISKTLKRCTGPGFSPRPIVVAADAHRFWVTEALKDLGREGDILLEPLRRDSCAAIVAGAVAAAQRDPESLVLVVAADHLIPDETAFQNAVLGATDAAEGGWIITFGIAPTEPATGYGYIAPSHVMVGRNTREIEVFKEKPDRATAESYIRDGYLWNSGNFLFKARHFLAEAERLVPDIHAAIVEALAKARKDLGFMRLDPDAFARSPQISVDYAIMEKTKKKAVAPVAYAWSDIGSWDAVAKSQSTDDAGNSRSGKAVLVKTTNTTVLSSDRLTTVVGCQDLVVVSTRDAVLVAQKGQTELVKSLVDQLTAAGHPEAVRAQLNYRPWGSYEVLDKGAGYELRRVLVHPGQRIVPQNQRGGSTHWTLLGGSIDVTVNQVTQCLTAGQTISVPAQTAHALINTSQTDALLIELQVILGKDPTSTP